MGDRAARLKVYNHEADKRVWYRMEEKEAMEEYLEMLREGWTM